MLLIRVIFIKIWNILNYKKFTLRGFHYQKGSKAEGKLLSCLNGEIYDAVLDLRKNSPTYLKTFEIKLSDKNMRSIFIPKGCANAVYDFIKNI